MSSPPPYFEAIRAKAERRWLQLEEDNELRGSWLQLFRQVQNPRHVLSELLQNADDARATEASVSIADGTFSFFHNGADFTEEQFASLCRFGYSNKRSLHTIGFRGIGFKSTFSLGPQVELITPTLAVAFHRKRFTQPHWLSGARKTVSGTAIRVCLGDTKIQKAVETNLQQWSDDPISLLFFRHLRSLRVNDRELRWHVAARGPVAQSKWMKNSEGSEVLLINSSAEAFPDECRDEIQEERILGDSDDLDLPPAIVQIAVGANGRLYVVLPTNIETSFSFCCNAAFVQDPARVGLKSPSSSPTNRWLLSRVGRLVASALTGWLQNTDLSLSDRARAYELLPEPGYDTGSMAGECAQVIDESFFAAIETKPVLLAENGAVKKQRECIALPSTVMEVWPSKAASIFDTRDRPALGSDITEQFAQTLVSKGMVEEIGLDDVVARLRVKQPPKPSSWSRLARLWEYVEPKVRYDWTGRGKDLNIVPVLGESVLHCALRVVRVAKTRGLESEADWQFLSALTPALDHNWVRFLTEAQRRSADIQSEDASRRHLASNLLGTFSLNRAAEASELIEVAASRLFSNRIVDHQACVRLAQIAAKLRVKIGPSFRYFDESEVLRKPDAPLFADLDGSIVDMVPPQILRKHRLHQSYVESFVSCTSKDWFEWIASGSAGLLTMPPFQKSVYSFHNLSQLRDHLQRRTFLGSVPSTYRSPWFQMTDWDFGNDVWEHWEKRAANDPTFWGKVTENLLSQNDSFWSEALSPTLLEVAGNGYARNVHVDGIPANWIVKLREMPCLPDVHGALRKPSELLRRNATTEALIEVEPFLKSSLDQEHNRPLLDALGVRDTPTGASHLLDRIRALTKAKNPPRDEVDKWYRRLDRLLETAATEDRQVVKEAFRSESLILAQDDTWLESSAVYVQSDDDDVPNAPALRLTVRDLAMWTTLGVSARPTVALALKWLRQLTPNSVLSPENAKRVKGLQSRHALLVWTECEHWLNVGGEWVPISALSFALTMRSLAAWSHLHDSTKQRIADFRGLPVDVTSLKPFSDVATLSSVIEERLTQERINHSSGVQNESLHRLGALLARVQFDDISETERVQTAARDLEDTVWIQLDVLELTPYINGVPVGTPRRAYAVWADRTLYVSEVSKGRLAKIVPEEIGKVFRRDDIKAALDYCFERDEEAITEYIEANFVLAPPKQSDQFAPVAPIVGSGFDEIEPKDRPAANDTEWGNEHPDAEVEEDRELEGENPPSRKRAHSSGGTSAHNKPSAPFVLELFARSQGFLNHDGIWRHADGSQIARLDGSTQFWLRTARTGEVVRQYWPRGHCLDREPLELPSEVWAGLDQSPDVNSLILLDASGKPKEFTGSRLRSLVDRGLVSLFPATYRIVSRGSTT